jgi:hypothetical protein
MAGRGRCPARSGGRDRGAVNVEARRAFWEAVFLAEVQFRTPADVADKADECLKEWVKRFDPPLAAAPARPLAAPTPTLPPDISPEDIKARPPGSVVFFGGKAMRKTCCDDKPYCDSCQRVGFHLEPL